MKRVITLIGVVIAAISTFAQTSSTGTVKGAVVDNNGNPLVGAIVTATGGAETTLVESDGTFVMEVPIWLKSITASYAGYESRTKKVDFNKDVIFKLNQHKRRGFLNVALGAGYEYAYEYAYESVMPTFGLMGGTLSNWGFYIKAMLGGNDDVIVANISAGATKRIYNNLYGYFGLGVGFCNYYAYDYYDYFGEYYNFEEKFYPTASADLGLLLKIGRHFNISIGCTNGIMFHGYYVGVYNLALGYVF